jgi:uncharacterized protein (DUF1800 family)
LNGARRFLLLLAALAAGAAQAAGMGAEDARHFLARTGFDAPLDRIEEYARLSRREAVERELNAVRQTPRTAAPAWVNDWQPPARVRSMGAEERQQYRRELVARGLELKGWWLQEMLATDSPLTERMTLFWHDHFTSSLQKVRSPILMYRQNLLLRSHALGSFAELLRAVSKNPAMLVYLDTAASRRGQPNENFAREVMELFTLGEGHYSEQDVKEAARAFTGWSIEPGTGEFRYRPFFHDGGAKALFGRSGDLDGDDVLDLLLARPETSRLIAAKLWREFVSPGPADERERAQLEQVARTFRETGYSIRAALRELLLSEAFWARSNRGALVKSPADLVVGTLREFRIGYADPLPFVLVMRQLGQDLFAPPNVKGWPGGEAWISSKTLLARRQFVERLLRVDESRMLPASMREPDPAKPMRGRFVRALLDIRFSAGDWLRPFEGREAALQAVLLPMPPANPPPAAQGMELARALVADPVYQLK